MQGHFDLPVVLAAAGSGAGGAPGMVRLGWIGGAPGVGRGDDPPFVPEVDLDIIKIGNLQYNKTLQKLL